MEKATNYFLMPSIYFPYSTEHCCNIAAILQQHCNKHLPQYYCNVTTMFCAVRVVPAKLRVVPDYSVRFQLKYVIWCSAVMTSVVIKILFERFWKNRLRYEIHNAELFCRFRTTQNKKFSIGTRKEAYVYACCGSLLKKIFFRFPGFEFDLRNCPFGAMLGTTKTIYSDKKMLDF